MEVKTEGKRNGKMKGKRKYKRKDAWQEMIKRKMEGWKKRRLDLCINEWIYGWVWLFSHGSSSLMDLRNIELCSLLHQQIDLDSAVFLDEMSYPMLLSLPHLQGLMASGSTRQRCQMYQHMEVPEDQFVSLWHPRHLLVLEITSALFTSQQSDLWPYFLFQRDEIFGVFLEKE